MLKLASEAFSPESLQFWSWSLGAVSIVGFLLIGRRVWWAWYVNVFAQVIWIMYWFMADNYGPIVTNVVYILVFVQNSIMWSREYHIEEAHLPKNERKLGRFFPRRVESDDE